MNQTFLPPSIVTLESLLRVLTDPKEAKKTLDDIKKATAIQQKQAEDVAAKVKAHDDLVKEIERREADLKKRQEQTAKDIAKLADLQSRHADLDRAQAAHAEAVKDYARRDAALKENETKIKQEQTKLANAQAALDKRAEKLAQNEADYNQRVARLRSIAGVG